MGSQASDFATNAPRIEWLIHIRKKASQSWVAPGSIWKEHSQRHILAAVWVSFWFLFHSQLVLYTEKKCAEHIGLKKARRASFSFFFFFLSINQGMVKETEALQLKKNRDYTFCYHGRWLNCLCKAAGSVFSSRQRKRIMGNIVPA